MKNDSDKNLRGSIPLQVVLIILALVIWLFAAIMPSKGQASENGVITLVAEVEADHRVYIV